MGNTWTKTREFFEKINDSISNTGQVSNQPNSMNDEHDPIASVQPNSMKNEHDPIASDQPNSMKDELDAAISSIPDSNQLSRKLDEHNPFDSNKPNSMQNELDDAISSIKDCYKYVVLAFITNLIVDAGDTAANDVDSVSAVEEMFNSVIPLIR